MFCTTDLLVSSSLPRSVLLLLWDLVGDMASQKCHSPLPILPFLWRQPQKFRWAFSPLIPFAAKVLSQTLCLFYMKRTASVMWRQISVLPVWLRSLELHLHGFSFFWDGWLCSFTTDLIHVGDSLIVSVKASITGSLRLTIPEMFPPSRHPQPFCYQ